jgi:hypothetical protein
MVVYASVSGCETVYKKRTGFLWLSKTGYKFPSLLSDSTYGC